MSVVIAAPGVDAQLVSDLTTFATSLLRAAGYPQAELSLAIVSDAEIAALNARHRNRSGPTDVLSFSLVEGEHADFRGVMLGDVVVALGVAERQAAEQGVSVTDELRRLVIHGLLHLVGFDHELPEEARAMRAEEERLWREVSD